ncbi:MAG: hypothetical protein DWH78_13110 [Planctomycetota bacterium]|nr:MAG: hypothetical protein DWH78_13110 [Planctomycetota bacterium]
MIFAQSVEDGDADRDICEFSSRVRSFFRCVCEHPQCSRSSAALAYAVHIFWPRSAELSN